MLLRLFLRKIILYKPYLILLLQPVMALQQPLHVAEFPFQQVGRVRDVQLRKILKAKQPWQMPLQAVASTTQLLVRVVRLACFRIYAAPVQEGFVPHQPVMQVRGKAVFSATRQRQRKRPQFACRLAFQLFAQVADEDFDLVKLAHLHQNAGKRSQ